MGAIRMQERVRCILHLVHIVSCLLCLLCKRKGATKYCHISESNFSLEVGREVACGNGGISLRIFNNGQLQDPAAVPGDKRFRYPMNMQWRGLLSLSGR